VSGDLQRKLAISALVEQASGTWLLHRQSAQDERAGGVAQILTSTFALQTNAFNRFQLSSNPLGEGGPGMCIRVKANPGLPLPTDGLAQVRLPEVLDG
jgi:hypothetical protein